MVKPRIIGEGQVPEAAAFHDVRDAFEGWGDLVLSAHLAPVLKESIPKGSVIYNMEPLYYRCRSFSIGYRDVLERFPVLDYQRRNVDYLATLGIAATHVPYGYHRGLERVVHAGKAIDVLFVGSVNPRRMPILTSLAASNLVFVSARGVYGPRLDWFVARSKVCVNVHYCDEHPLEVVRLNYLMANGCCVVSEPGWDAAENARYANGLVFCAYRDLVKQCIELAANVGARADLSRDAKGTVRAMSMPTRAEVFGHA